MKDINLAQDLGVTYPYKPREIAKPEYAVVPRIKRWSQLDMARGIAISLMIISHCVKGLMFHTKIPDWGLIPIHLLTKFSSSLFIVIFGISLSLFFLPYVNSEKWPDKRKWMLKRGIELMIWYKILTVVQMFQFYPESMIVDTLLFKSMPDFVEILCFYSIALMWIPFLLPSWSKMSFVVKAILAMTMIFAGQWLHYNFDFWGMKTLKAILVEHEGFYTFGQLQRGGIILIGLLLGDIYQKLKEDKVPQHYFSISCAVIGLSSLSYFFLSNSNHLSGSLLRVAKNIGKHPLDLNFAAFSLGGAFLVLGLCLLSSTHLQKLMKPIAYLGKNSMNAFILHIIIIFYFYRYYFALHHKVTYLQSLGLTAGCIGLCVIALYIWNKSKAVFA